MHLFFFKYAKKRIIEACEVFFIWFAVLFLR